jgi:leucyl-tRNA---protein transferase
MRENHRAQGFSLISQAPPDSFSRGRSKGTASPHCAARHRCYPQVRRSSDEALRLSQIPRDTPQFYLTSPTPCPYLAGQTERKVFTHLVGRRARDLNDVLTQGGFRRSQTIAYRPACEGCRACVSVRVVVNDFRPSDNMKRVMKANADIVGEMKVNKPTSEHYSLFRGYLDARHGEGGMADMTVLDFAMMVEDSHVETAVVEYRRRGPDTPLNSKGQGPLIAVSLTDILSDGLSMVYSFFEPDHEDRSLGTLMILDHIARARSLGLPYLYLGYWVSGSQKMDYKGRFKPQERLHPEGWVRVER